MSITYEKYSIFSGVNIFHENRNYSEMDPEKFKTFPKFKKKIRIQITMILRRFRSFFFFHRFYFFQKSFLDSSQNFSEIPQISETIPRCLSQLNEKYLPLLSNPVILPKSKFEK